LFTGYSDFFAVSTDILSDWFDCLGPLAALSLFAEVAIPTAHVLAARRMENFINIGKSAQILWGDTRYTIEDINWIRARFEAGDAFIHPVKFNTYNEEYLAGLRQLFNSTRI
jgi:hypothetical protein